MIHIIYMNFYATFCSDKPTKQSKCFGEVFSIYLTLQGRVIFIFSGILTVVICNTTVLVVIVLAVAVVLVVFYVDPGGFVWH